MQASPKTDISGLACIFITHHTAGLPPCRLPTNQKSWRWSFFVKAAAETGGKAAEPPPRVSRQGIKGKWLCHRKWLMLYFWLCHSTWLFCFSNILKIYAFSPNFPLVGSVIGGFYWLFLWNFKEIKHQPFSMTLPYFLFLFIFF